MNVNSQCLTITEYRLVRDDTQEQVDYLLINSSTQVISLYTEDLDMTLRDQEIVYKLLVSSNDGQVDIEAASLTVQFTGVNNAPYFVPILPGVLQIFKQSEPF